MSAFKLNFLVLATLILGLLPAQAAMAQFGQAAGIGELMKPEYTRADVRIVSDTFGLDADQRAVVESLFEDYRDNFDDGFERLRDELSSLSGIPQDTDPRNVREAVFKPFDLWREERRNIGRGLLEDIQLILTGPQMDLWDRFERRLLREKSLLNTELAGENADLFLSLRDAHVPDPVLEAIRPLLDEYDVALNSALLRRNELIHDESGAMLQALTDDNFVVMLEQIMLQVNSRKLVRDLHDTYRDEIAEALPADLGASFRSESLVRGYPRVFRAQTTEKIFDDVLASDFSTEILSRVATLYQAYLAELAVIKAELLVAIRDSEPKLEINHAEIYVARQTKSEMNREQDPVPSILRERDSTNESYIEQLYNLLGEDAFMQVAGGERWLAKRERAAARAKAQQEHDERMRARAQAQERSKSLNSGGSRRGDGNLGNGNKN